jgi:hypothetical protein
MLWNYPLSEVRNSSKVITKHSMKLWGHKASFDTVQDKFQPLCVVPTLEQYLGPTEVCMQDAARASKSTKISKLQRFGSNI